MSYKVPMYYIVKVQEGRTANEIVKDVEYLAGPFGRYDGKLIDAKHKFENETYSRNSYAEIATQYIEVEL